MTHQAGGDRPVSRLGAQLSKPVQTTWQPRPPGQTRMKYDGTPSLWRANPYLAAKLGARNMRAGDLPADVIAGENANGRGH